MALQRYCAKCHFFLGGRHETARKKIGGSIIRNPRRR
jgi:hypothetical protein